MRIFRFLPALALFGAVSLPSAADITPDAARALLAKLEPAVVSVRAVSKTTMSSEGRESSKDDVEAECTGVVVNAAGLTAVSLSGVDPYSVYSDMMSSEGADSSFQVQSEVTDIKIHFADGTEIPGEIAIRDRDLDLAFIKPKTALPAAASFVDLASPGEASILDPVMTVYRFGRQNRWETVAKVQSIQSVLTKPRRMYLVEGLAMSSNQQMLGSLAASQDGKVLGMELLRKVPGSGKDRPTLLLVVLPAKDINAVAKQVESGQIPPEKLPTKLPPPKTAPSKKPAPKKSSSAHK